MEKFSRGIFSVIADVVFFWVGEGGREGEGERWKHSVQFVGNFFEATARHITFKRLEVGRRVRFSLLVQCLLVRREEKGRKEKRRDTTEEENGGRGRQRRKEREEGKKKGREKKRRRGERGPPCSCPARHRV